MSKNDDNTVVCEFLIQNDIGIHARPAAAFVRTASNYRSEVKVSKGEESVDGKSIMGLLMLKVCTGSTIVVEVVGEDASEAAKAIRHLIDDKNGVFNLPVKNG